MKFLKDQGLTRLGGTQFATVITVPDDDVVGVAISLGGLFRLRRDLYILALDQNGERV